MTEREKIITENYNLVKYKIEEAIRRRGGGEDVTLLAATKTVPAEEIVFAAKELGLRFAGENRAQEFTAKYDAVSPYLDYQFIGSLQKNKVKYVVGRASLIHSVSSISLAEEISARAVKLGITQNVLLEINIAREESKHGFLPEESDEAIGKIRELPGVNLRGIMTMGAAGAEKDALRKYFQKSYAIFIDNFPKKTHNISDTILSMGMSGSFEQAIEEGATLVRVGSAVFGSRNP